MNEPGGETDTARPPEQIEMQNMNNDNEEQQQQQEQRQQQETDFGAGQQQQQQADLGGDEEENEESRNVGDARNQENEEFKQKEFKNYWNIPIKRDWAEDFFDNVKFVPRKSGLSTGKITYKGEEVFYIQKGKILTYAGKENLAAEFRGEIRDIKLRIRTANYSNGLIVNIGLTPGEIDRFDNMFKEAERENTQRKREILDQLEEEIGRLDAEDNERLLRKAKQVADQIRTELLGELPRYDDPEEVEMVRRDRFIELLKRFRERLKRGVEWLRSRLPLIGAIVGVAAGVFTLVYGIISWTKGAVVATAKATSSFGKAVAKFLAKFGPIMASIGSFVISLMSYLARGLMFIASNLWILFLAHAGFLYNEYRKRK